MMEQKEEGISLGEIFRVIFKKKWLLLGVTVVIMLIGVIIVQAFYNPSKEQYHVDFELEFPNREDGLFPDGKKVLYAEFISYENLEKAKSKDESFSSIDVAKMLEKNDIDIKEETIVLSNGERVSTGKYTITVLKKYFTSSEQAANYMKAVFQLGNIMAKAVYSHGKINGLTRFLPMACRMALWIGIKTANYIIVVKPMA